MSSQSIQQQQKHKLINPLTRYEDFKFELPPNTFPRQVLQTSFKHPPDCGEESYVASGRLRGRHALVTGGGSGIGRAVVIALAREGAKVAINYLPEEEPDAQALEDFLRKDSCVEHDLVRIPGDLRSQRFCHALVHSAHEKLGALDLIVSNAGTTGQIEPFSQLSLDSLDDIMKVNFYASFPDIAPVYVTLADDKLSYGTGSIYGSHGGFIGAY